MKRDFVFLFVVALLMLFVAAPVSAQSTCDLDAVLINQDPYPAVPGDYVKLVFQVTGVDDPSCGIVAFEFLPDFPFSLDPGVEAEQQIAAGTYISVDYEASWLVPYRVRVDEQAFDGENELVVRYGAKEQSENFAYNQKTFNITIENLLADFEVSIKDYDAATKTLTFEILNTGEADVEALTVEIPKQSAIEVKGSNRNIVGNLDSNEDTTFNFEATPMQGDIQLMISYTDQIDVRRQIEKSVAFDPSYFTDRQRDQQSVSPTVYVVGAIVLLIIIFWIRGIIRRRRMRKK